MNRKLSIVSVVLIVMSAVAEFASSLLAINIVFGLCGGRIDFSNALSQTQPASILMIVGLLLFVAAIIVTVISKIKSKH